MQPENIYDATLDPFGGEQRFTRAEVQDKLEIAARVQADRDFAERKFRGDKSPDFLKANMATGLEFLDDSPMTGSFAKRARQSDADGRRRIDALKSALNNSELEKARKFLSSMPACLDKFELGELAVIFTDGEPSGTVL